MTGEPPPPDRDPFGTFLPPVAPPTSVGPPVPPPYPSPAYPPPGHPPAAPAPPAPTGTQPPPWSPWTGILATLAGFGIASVLTAILLLAVAGTENGELGDIPAAASIAALVLQDVILLAVALGAAALAARPRPWHFGWRPVRAFWPAVGWGALLYVSFIALAAGWLTLIGQTDEKDTLAQDLGADESVAAAIVIAVLVAYAAPVVEELLFRGLMFGSLRSRLGVLPAAAITGVLFGGAHAAGSPPAFLLPLAFLGFGLCLLYHRTGSLYPSMAVHAINNSVAIVGALGWRSELIPVVIAASLTLLLLTGLAVRTLGGPVPADAPAP